MQKYDLPAAYFGEGIVKWGGKLIELEYQSGIGFLYDFATFQPRGTFHYPPEGSSLTTDGKRLIMDDGTPQLRFWDPETLQETGRLTVTDRGQPVEHLNELEWIKGEIFANIWLTDRVEDGPRPTDVLNGIAYDPAADRLFVTGKRWPKLFEIKLIQRSAQ